MRADGRLSFSGGRGVVLVIAAARECRLLAGTRFDEGFIASPAIAGEALIPRSLTRLYRVDAGA